MFRYSMLTASLVLCISASLHADSKTSGPSSLLLRPGPVEVRLSDGSRLFLTLGEESLSVTTAYGKLEVKMAEIQQIDFGLRAPVETARRVEAAVALLASATEKKSDAWITLADAREWAYPALVRLTKHADPAIASKAREMAAVLNKAMPAERLKRIDRDLIHTEHSKIAGRIDTHDLKAFTTQFGQRTLKLNDLASLRKGELGEPEEVPVNVQPDPGYLSNFQQHLGQSFYFRVTGAAGGSVWGTDVYTTDSSLAAVAVHAGVLKMGQTGIVKVTILAGQNSYAGSMRNGIGTSGYGQYPGSYKVSRVGQKRED